MTEGLLTRAIAMRQPGMFLSQPGTYAGRKHAGSDLGQLALRRLLSAPAHASGGPELRRASANQLLGPG